MIRTHSIGSLRAAFLASLLLLGACRHAPDETQVRAAIAAAGHAAGEGSASGVDAELSEDFDGNAGAFDRRALSGIVRLFALRHERIGVTVGPVSIEHRGDRMVATFTATLSSGSHLLPDQLGVYDVVSAWRKEHGEWRCYSATWKHPG